MGENKVIEFLGMRYYRDREGLADFLVDGQKVSLTAGMQLTVVTGHEIVETGIRRVMIQGRNFLPDSHMAKWFRDELDQKWVKFKLDGAWWVFPASHVEEVEYYKSAPKPSTPQPS